MNALDVTRDEAQKLVLGIATARMSNNIDDAHLLLRDYLQGSSDRGVSLAMTWTILFSAAMTWFTEVVGMLADDDHLSPQAELNALALAFAREMDHG